MLGRLGRFDEAIASAAKAHDMLQQLSAAAPTNATLRHYLAESYDAYADVYASKGDLERSSRFLRETRAIYQQLAAADPSDKMSRANLAWSDLAIAENLLRQNKVEDAMPLIREGLALFEKKSNPSKGYWFAVEVGQSYLDLGRAWAMLAQSAPSSRNRTQFWQNAVASDQNALAIRTLDPTALDANGHVNCLIFDANSSKPRPLSGDRARSRPPRAQPWKAVRRSTKASRSFRLRNNSATG